MRNKKRFRLVISAIVFVFVVPSSAALGCVNYGSYPSLWDDNCTVGDGYDEAGNFITGLQRILTYLSYSPGSWDGLWGANTEGAVEDFQGDHSLTVDGVVGPNTWFAFADHMNSCFLMSGYQYFRSDGFFYTCFDAADDHQWRLSQGSGTMYIKKLDLTWQTQFSAFGPN